jgi:phasin
MSELEKAPAAKPVKETVKKIAAATKPAETFEAFSLSATEMPEAFREAAEKTVKQAKESYEKMRAAAEEATDLIEDQIETARSGITALNAKALDAAKANVDASFQFAKDVLGVKTFAEVIELQSAFARQQFELVSAQAKEMQDLVQKVTTESTQPVKDAMTKFMKDLKVA